MNIFKKYKELELRVRIIEFKEKHPQPYKVGDKFIEKDCIVTRIEPYHRVEKIYSLFIDDIYWYVEYTNIKTGYTGSRLMQ